MQSREWIQRKMPVLLTMSLGNSDQWVRDGIRGSSLNPPFAQRVVLQGTEEADRVYREVANLKVKRGKPFGGGVSEAWRG